jgi:branched-chain amino acid transport system substrate-binding protein
MTASGYQGVADRQKFVEAIEAMTDIAAGDAHPQGSKRFNGKTHQVFGSQNISKVEGGKLVRVHRTTIDEGMYADAVDYTTQSF